VIPSETTLNRVDSEAGSLATSSYAAEDLAPNRVEARWMR
jgi:hypothetical protein